MRNCQESEQGFRGFAGGFGVRMGLAGGFETFQLILCVLRSVNAILPRKTGIISV